MGLFQELQQRHVNPLLVSKQFGAAEDVVLQADSGNIAAIGLVAAIDRIEVDDQPADLETTIRVPQSQVAVDVSTIQSATLRGNEWHVVAAEPTEQGLVLFSLRRKHIEAGHSNIFDLNDEQAGWS